MYIYFFTYILGFKKIVFIAAPKKNTFSLPKFQGNHIQSKVFYSYKDFEHHCFRVTMTQGSSHQQFQYINHKHIKEVKWKWNGKLENKECQICAYTALYCSIFIQWDKPYLNILICATALMGLHQFTSHIPINRWNTATCNIMGATKVTMHIFAIFF